MAEKSPLKTFLKSKSQTSTTEPAKSAAKKAAAKAAKSAKATAPRKAAKSAAPAAEAMPLTHPDHDPVYDAKINFFVTRDMERALKVAAADSRLSVAALLRGMIDLWQDGAESGNKPASRDRKAVEIRARKHHRR